MENLLKKISTNYDLAIFGGKPAFEEPLHVGRPNIGNREKFLFYAEQILDTKWLTNNGPLVQELEQRVAAYHGVKHCVAMCNGTVALEIAIRALELQGEVIVPSFTFVATAHALSWQEITPVFADIRQDTHCLDPGAVRRMITPRTTGIIGVHLWGRPAEISELQALADEFQLKLMFDAAHAFGCSYQGEMVGQFGACEVLSFHATKLLNTFEGGAVLTNNDEFAEKIKLMRNFGFSGIDNVIHPGTNGKMTEISAAMGLANLDSIENIIAANKRNYLFYRSQLEGIPGIKLLPYTDRPSNYQYIVIEVSDDYAITRDELVEALNAENILARRYFWPGCHLMKPYKELYPNAGLMLPITQQVAQRIVVLPTGTTIDEAQINVVVSVISALSKVD